MEKTLKHQSERNSKKMKKEITEKRGNNGTMSTSTPSATPLKSYDTVLPFTVNQTLPALRSEPMHYYRFYPSEPVLQTEVYLPKKCHFQSRLYTILQNGLDLKTLKAHFLDETKRQKINHLLENYFSIRDYPTELINDMRQVYYGCSIGEVDGIYYNPETGIDDERSQVIRLIFRPDLSDLFKRYPGNEKYIIDTSRSILGYRFGHELMLTNDELDKIQQDVRVHIISWIQTVGLFIFGFFIYELCEEITQRCNAGLMSWDKAEKEIWITSMITCNLNRIVLQ